jgi:formylglycine-generating enzyme required for sulfatase activity
MRFVGGFVALSVVSTLTVGVIAWRVARHKSTGAELASAGSVFPIEASPAPPPPAQAAPPCPDNMVLVEGDYCTKLEHKCIRKRPKQRGCDEYAKGTQCEGDLVHMRFCVDKYEFPNVEGQKPAVMQNWYDADRECRAQGKRTCGSHEWTLACEGPERLPYPYGYVRDAQACSIDKKGPQIDEKRFYSADKEKEVARLSQSDPSGSRPGCVSAYGVYDLTGNVDEWTDNESRKPHRGMLKGGNWGEWRNACRPDTYGHEAWFRYYQTGFRCCANPK